MIGSDPVLTLRVGRLVFRLALDGVARWQCFHVYDGVRSPYASRWHGCTEDLPLWPARGRRLLLGPVNVSVLWRARAREVAARVRALGEMWRMPS